MNIEDRPALYTEIRPDPVVRLADSSATMWCFVTETSNIPSRGGDASTSFLLNGGRNAILVAKTTGFAAFLCV